MRDGPAQTVIVVGASRGLGRGIAEALAEAGHRVIAVARSGAGHGPIEFGFGSISSIAGDGKDRVLPARLLESYDPDAIIITGGAVPHMRPLSQQTWETFSLNWDEDVQIAFRWVREILLRPMRAGGRVAVFSSGAALTGSPLSGGYAGAKATQRFLVDAARDEALRGGLDLTFTALLPRFAPDTGVGATAVRAYATRSGLTVADFFSAYRQTNGPPITPESSGSAIAGLLRDRSRPWSASYLLTGHGIEPLD